VQEKITGISDFFENGATEGAQSNLLYKNNNECILHFEFYHGKVDSYVSLQEDIA
jgi:hypothetical protein